MGLSASKRVQKALHASPEFNSVCASTYADCLALNQHAFPGVRPYQLFSATESLHRTLSHSLRLVAKWVPLPPDRTQVHRALEAVLSRRAVRGQEITLDEVEFKELATEVFADAVVSSAGREILNRVPLGAVGIAAVCMVVKPGKEVVAAAIGTYAVGVATSIYLSLNG